VYKTRVLAPRHAGCEGECERAGGGVSVRVYALRALRMRWAHEETPVKDKLRCSGCDKPFRTQGGLDYHAGRTGHGAAGPAVAASESWPSRDDFLAMCGVAYDEMNGQIAGVQFLTLKTLRGVVCAGEATSSTSLRRVEGEPT
jgi:hypothetical protein